jgi:hypothetical protein
MAPQHPNTPTLCSTRPLVRRRQARSAGGAAAQRVALRRVSVGAHGPRDADLRRELRDALLPGDVVVHPQVHLSGWFGLVCLLACLFVCLFAADCAPALHSKRHGASQRCRKIECERPRSARGWDRIAGCRFSRWVPQSRRRCGPVPSAATSAPRLAHIRSHICTTTGPHPQLHLHQGSIAPSRTARDRAICGGGGSRVLIIAARVRIIAARVLIIAARVLIIAARVLVIAARALIIAARVLLIALKGTDNCA